MDIVFQIIVLLFAVILHEVAHGAVANALGDPTAKYQGRLTLNPLKHLEPFGSFFLPLFTLFVSGGRFVFGWAKPVPYNPHNLKNQRWGPAWVALAGPATNLLLAAFFAFLLRMSPYLAAFYNEPLVIFFNIIVFVNVLLGVFNLVPIPPLDGSKVLYALLPYRWRGVEYFLERYGMFILLIFLFFGFQLITPLIFLIYELLVGNIPIVF